MIVDFYKMEAIHFYIIRQLISLFSANEGEADSAFYNIFSCHFKVLLSEYISLRVVWDLCEICYRYYCPSLKISIQLAVPPQNFSVETPSNDYNNTNRHQRKNVVTRKQRRI
jgi:hypothetical protein